MALASLGVCPKSVEVLSGLCVASWDLGTPHGSTSPTEGSTGDHISPRLGQSRG